MVSTHIVYRPDSLCFLADRARRHADYGLAVSHAALIGIALYCLARWVKSIRRPRLISSREDGHLWLWIHAAAFGMTALLMLAGVRARTHYLVIAYPLPFVWLAWLLLTHGSTRLYRTTFAATGYHDHADAACIATGRANGATGSATARKKRAQSPVTEFRARI